MFDLMPLALTSQELLTNVRNFAGPLLLLVIGALSVRFLMRQQLSKFLVFIVVAILVLILFYSDVILQLAGGVGEQVAGVDVPDSIGGGDAGGGAV